jgi:adenosylcobinamide-phosphate synthase
MVTLGRASARAGVEAVHGSAKRHRSPNAGWPEAAMAGALGVALAGPRRYGAELVDDAWMNPAGRRDLDATDIGRALTQFRISCLLLAGLVGLLFVLSLSAGL